MAVLEKIRVKFGILITVLVAAALLSFIIDPQTLQSAAQMFSSENKVGEMDGKNISYKDFYEKVDYYTNISEMLGQGVKDEQSQTAVRDVAWESLFDEYVFFPAAKNAGIAVGEQEMLDLTTGSHISPILAQQGIFVDKDGNFSPAALSQFVQSIDGDETGQSARYWEFLESSVYKARLTEKYGTLIKELTLQSNIEKENIIASNNVTYDVDYITIPVGFGADSTITVSAGEIKKYYNDRKANLKQPANRDIEYVMYEVEPSAEDIAEGRAQFEAVYNEFKTTDALKNFILVNSDEKWDAAYYTKEQLESTPEYAKVAFGGAKVSEIVTTGNSFSAVRVADRAMRSEKVKISYAVFPFNEEAKADELVSKARTKGKTSEFTALGEDWLTQEILAANGLSDLNGAFAAGVKVLKIRSIAAQGYIVIYVTDRTAPVKMVQLAKLVKNVLPSEVTYRDFLIKATNLADKADGDINKFNEAVQADNLPVIPVSNITEDTRRIGVCDNARELVRWIFDKKTSKGDVSDVIVIDNKYYFVAAVTETRKEGIIPLKDVADDIRMAITTEKKVEKLQAETAAKIEGITDINAVATALDATVSHRTGVSVGSQYQQYDNTFLGALANAEKGVICGPYKSDMGVVIFTVSQRNEGSFFTEDDVKTYNSQKAMFGTRIINSVLSQDADIKDYRARFF